MDRRETSKPPQIGFVRPRRRRVLVSMVMDGAFGLDAVRGINDWNRDNGANWSIRFVDGPKLYALALHWLVREKKIDGVITLYHGREEMAALRRAGIPVSIIDANMESHEGRPPRQGSGVAYIGFDIQALAREAVDHFLSRADFRSGGYVENSFDHGWSRKRGDACIAEFHRRGLPTRRFLHFGEPSRLGTGRGPDLVGLAAWLRDIEKPAAVIAANDLTAADIISVCAGQGIAVPRAVSVLGMDDNPLVCCRCEPNVSSVHFDGYRAGHLAAESLSAMFDGRSPLELSPVYGISRIVQRGSSAATPSIGEIVQKALDYIGANACAGATVADVVRHCGYSRSLVLMRFHQMIGKSIEQAIRARKLDEARRLLRETRLSAEEMAPMCGYESASSLRRAFLRETGFTLNAWRKACVEE